MDYKFFSINEKGTIFNQCVRCGICIGICPVYRISRLETDSPRGRLELMRCLDENKATSYCDCKASLLRCLFCLRCQRSCPAGVEFDLAFFRTMGLISKTYGDTFRNPIQPIYSRGSRNHLLTSVVNSHLLEEGFKNAHKRAQEITIFPGCFIEIKEIKKIQSFLKDNGIDALIISEDICCGLPYLLQGNQEETLRCVKRNVNIFYQMKVKSIFTPCPFCLKMFTTYYPLFLNQTIKIEFNHICNLFSSIELKPICNFSKKLAYHSPCLLDQKTASNHQHIIEQLAGGSYISIPAQICCGHGVELPKIDEELSKQICQRNLSRIIEKGVQVLVTDCPSCTTNWIEGVQEKNLDLEVIPFWDFVVKYDGLVKTGSCSL